MAQLFYNSEPAARHHLYVGGSQDGAGAIHVLSFDSATGAITQSAAASAVLPSVPWCAVSPGGNSLYASVRAGAGEENNYVAPFAIDRRSGALSALPVASTVTRPPHLHPTLTHPALPIAPQPFARRADPAVAAGAGRFRASLR